MKSTSVGRAGTTVAEQALGAPSASTVVREVFEQGGSQLNSQFSTFTGNPLSAKASWIPNPGAALDADLFFIGSSGEFVDRWRGYAGCDRPLLVFLCFVVAVLDIECFF